MKTKRFYILLMILLNFSIFISYSLFFPLEKGIISYVPGTDTNVDEAIAISEKGKFNFFFNADKNSAYGDGVEYIKIALGEKSIPPCSLRPLLPRFIGFIAGQLAQIVDKDNTKATQMNLLQPVMSFMNSVFLAIATLFLFLAIKKYLDDELLSGILAMGLILNTGTIQTSQFFMVDVVSCCIGAIIVYFFSQKKYFYVSIMIGLGVLVKEVILIYTILLIYPIINDKKQILKNIPLTFIPIIVFISIRLLMNVDPLSMQYGWNISKGEVKLSYLIQHVGTIKSTIGFGLRVFFTFGVLWFFAFKAWAYKDKKLIIILFLMILAIIFANLLLASRVTRVISVMFPVIAILSAIGISNLLKRDDTSTI